MKKLALIWLLFGTVLLGGCMWNKEKTKEEIKNEIFAKKIECAKLIDSILLREGMGSTFIVTDYGSKKMEGPYFSEALNSCFYGTIRKESRENKLYEFLIRDALNNDILRWSEEFDVDLEVYNTIHSENFYKANQTYLDLIKERKTE